MKPKVANAIQKKNTVTNAHFHADGKPIVHKTFHSYTVRKSQGNAQSSRDLRTANNAKSAGASLRRYNEASLTQVLSHFKLLLTFFLNKHNAN